MPLHARLSGSCGFECARVPLHARVSGSSGFECACVPLHARLSGSSGFECACVSLHARFLLEVAAFTRAVATIAIICVLVCPRCVYVLYMSMYQCADLSIYLYICLVCICLCMLLLVCRRYVYVSSCWSVLGVSMYGICLCIIVLIYLYLYMSGLYMSKFPLRCPGGINSL